MTHFLNSATARILSATLTNPIQVLRTRIEIIGFNEYSGIFDGFKKVYAQEGLKGFSSGMLTTILREGPFAGVYFVIYKKMKNILNVIF